MDLPNEDSEVIPVRPHGGRSVPDEPEDIFVDVERDVGNWTKFGYGFGHFYNDLCASMWFTYLMIFLEKVLSIPSAMAGFLMLIGQVVDAVATPLVGIASDRSLLPECCSIMGRRLSWHVIGTILVTASFPFIFNACLACDEHTLDWWRTSWFVLPIVVFQIGWASVQISHLSLIPELSHVDSSRRTMNSIRYGFTVLANLLVYILLFYLMKSTNDPHHHMDKHDLPSIRMVAFLVVGAGLLSSLPFYLIVKEPRHFRTYQRSDSRVSNVSHVSQLSRMQWTSWFGYIQFYQIALLYMLARLYMNVSQVYMTYYVTVSQNHPKAYVATVPMVSFVSSFGISLFLSISYIHQHLNKKALYVVGLVIGLGNCGLMLVDLPGDSIYFFATLLGVAQSILLVTSLDITADLINRNTESGAFVYGAMSLADKLANGIACLVIQLIKSSTCDTQVTDVLWKKANKEDKCAEFYRVVMVYVTGGCLVLSFLVLISLLSANIGQRVRSSVVARPDDIVRILQNEEEEERE